MEKSKVYFTNLRTHPGVNLLDKMEKLARKAGFDILNFREKFTAIKIHFGEPGNLAYIKPNFVRRVADMVKAKGGKPYLTDSNTLYSGRRDNAVDHIEAAFENGFNPIVTGCQVIIADGVKGTDYEEVIINQEYCKTAKIGKGIFEADIIIAMTHFKGHEQTGFGGALKNIGMGCASTGGKLELHSSSKPTIEKFNCVGCNLCVKACAHKAIHLDENKKAYIDYKKCVGCGQCIAVCQYNATQVVWDESSDIMTKKIAEYTYAVTKDRPIFYINFITNVSPDCDCWSNNDMPIVPDIGIAASLDPVALDMACANMVKNAPALPGSRIYHGEHMNMRGEDKFKHIHPNTEWQAGLLHAEKIGLGKLNYEIIEI